MQNRYFTVCDTDNPEELFSPGKLLHPKFDIDAVDPNKPSDTEKILAHQAIKEKLAAKQACLEHFLAMAAPTAA